MLPTIESSTLAPAALWHPFWLTGLLACVQGLSDVAEPILVQNVLRDLKNEYSNTRMTRILHLFLNDRKGG